MERNHIIGFILIFATLLIFNIVSSPSKEELEKSQRTRDSIEMASKPKQALKAAPSQTATTGKDTTTQETASVSRDTQIVLENEVMKATLSSLGGRLVSVELKKYDKVQDIKGVPSKSKVRLLNDEKNVYDIRVIKDGKKLSTQNSIYAPTISGNTIKFNLQVDNKHQVTQTYTLQPNSYVLDYNISGTGFNDRDVSVHWINYIDKIELGHRYEQQTSTVYFKDNAEDNADYCSCTSNDSENLSGKSVQWLSHTNQFFNSSLISKSGGFKDAALATEVIEFTKSEDLKKLTSDFEVPLTNGSHQMQWYIGPNEFQTLKSFNIGLEEIIPYGSSIFGSLNRWVIRPFFDFLTGFISSKGLAIIFLIFLIKMMLYPLLYKMLHSQAKMAALKPELNKIKDKHKEDLQKQQMESMKVYQEFGVSPLAGCLPMLLQMPIWIALYRYFPASITFRQESFLWAPDLSSFDAFIRLSFEIPFMGSHLSLFTILWAVSTLVYTYYSTKDVDMSANPAMKYVQYFMPLMFLGFFNSYASGLTCYMFFSNLINILQTIITRKFIFDDEKIRKELDLQKNKPKKKGGFQSRLEEAMKQQQRLAEEKAKNKK
ncbi:MAG: membrane protein insertase YidC [Saprospiraceae bacterium]|nr:membrane protein insertase YidC [Saprospiraceae bacterium]